MVVSPVAIPNLTLSDAKSGLINGGKTKENRTFLKLTVGQLHTGIARKNAEFRIFDLVQNRFK